jgi:phage host-nuclease inhibitor protein Gam
MNKMTSSSIAENEPKTDFWAKMAELDAEIKRFEAAVEDFCEAKKEFLANL